MIRFVLTIL